MSGVRWSRFNHISVFIHDDLTLAADYSASTFLVLKAIRGLAPNYITDFIIWSTVVTGVETFNHQQRFNLFHIHINDNLLNEHLLSQDPGCGMLRHSMFMMLRRYLPFIVFEKCICLPMRSEINLYAVEYPNSTFCKAPLKKLLYCTILIHEFKSADHKPLSLPRSRSHWFNTHPSNSHDHCVVYD